MSIIPISVTFYVQSAIVVSPGTSNTISKSFTSSTVTNPPFAVAIAVVKENVATGRIFGAAKIFISKFTN